MSISSTRDKVTLGSAKLFTIHTRTVNAKEVAVTSRTRSQIENVMRHSPSRLRQYDDPPMPSRPLTVGSARPFTAGGTRGDGYSGLTPLPSDGAANSSAASSLRGARPSTASMLFATPSPRWEGGRGHRDEGHAAVNTTTGVIGYSPPNGRPSTAYAPRRAAQLAAAASSSPNTQQGKVDEGKGLAFDANSRRPLTAGNARSVLRESHHTPAPRRQQWVASAEEGCQEGDRERGGIVITNHANTDRRQPPIPKRVLGSDAAVPYYSAEGGSNALSNIPDIVDVSGEGFGEMMGGVGPGEGGEDVADDELLAALKAAYKRLWCGRARHVEGAADSPVETVHRLRREVEEALLSAGDETCTNAPATMLNADTAPAPSSAMPSLSDIASPDVLLLWTWSYAEDDAWAFMQSVKGSCGISPEMGENMYAQCEAIVGGLLSGELPYDAPPQPPAALIAASLAAYAKEKEEAGRSIAFNNASNDPHRNNARSKLQAAPIIVIPTPPKTRHALLPSQPPHAHPPFSSALDSFMDRYVGTFKANVIASIRQCVEDRGLAWCDAASALWDCALQHLRVGLLEEEEEV